jgi:transposase-like protein
VAVGEKCRIVEQTLKPGASVPRVALAHGVNANQVFSWRRQYLSSGKHRYNKYRFPLLVGHARAKHDSASKKRNVLAERRTLCH